jgi:hypothetical protein
MNNSLQSSEQPDKVTLQSCRSALPVDVIKSDPERFPSATDCNLRGPHCTPQREREIGAELHSKILSSPAIAELHLSVRTKLIWPNFVIQTS